MANGSHPPRRPPLPQPGSEAKSRFSSSAPAPPPPPADRRTSPAPLSPRARAGLASTPSWDQEVDGLQASRTPHPLPRPCPTGGSKGARPGLPVAAASSASTTAESLTYCETREGRPGTLPPRRCAPPPGLGVLSHSPGRGPRLWHRSSLPP